MVRTIPHDLDENLQYLLVLGREWMGMGEWDDYW